MPIFLPGFKKDRFVNLPIVAVPSSGGAMWQAPLRHSAFSEWPVSVATAQITADRHLLRLAFEVHGSRASGRGLIIEDGCDGKTTTPEFALLGHTHSRLSGGTRNPWDTSLNLAAPPAAPSHLSPSGSHRSHPAPT